MAVLLLTACNLVNGQTVIVTDRNSFATWDVILEKFNYGEWNYKEITFTANANGVTANDVAKSVYTFTSTRKTTTGKNKSGYTFTSHEWSAYDETYERCTFSIIKYSDGTAKISVLYDKSLNLLTYWIAKSSIKNYND